MRTINERSDATAMDEAVQNKMVSPRELVQATIREAERTNPKINAIVSQRYEKALKEAETRDFLERPSAGFLQVAGARVYYDTTFPAEKRILSIDILDQETCVYKPLNTNETYYLVTNDFLAAGGDGFTMLGGPREEGPSLDTAFADYLTHADLTKYAVIKPNSRTISISSADFAVLNKKENAEDPRVNPLNTIDRTVASKVLEKTKPVVSKVVTTPTGKAFFVSTSNETLKEIEKVTETLGQTEELPTTGDKASHAGLLGLGILLTIFGISGKHKGKEKY